MNQSIISVPVPALRRHAQGALSLPCATSAGVPRVIGTAARLDACDDDRLRCCPEEAPAGPVDLKLHFAVSLDEEFVNVHAIFGRFAIDLGCRTHNYLLLTLARRRLADAEAGLADGACGWVHPEELRLDSAMTPRRLNVDVHRVRRHFLLHGVPDAERVVERRAGLRQLRIGTGLLWVARV